tara:strand:+ start:583 stop:756 length:174 start_codon:yes stop_codon:yes gene_type:complete
LEEVVGRERRVAAVVGLATEEEEEVLSLQRHWMDEAERRRHSEAAAGVELGGVGQQR